MSKKYEKLPVGAAKALEDAGFTWYADAFPPYWDRDVSKDSYWKAMQEEAQENRLRAHRAENRLETFVKAIMKLLGVYARFPYQVKDEFNPRQPLWDFEADVLKATKDFEAERALKRIRKSVREHLLNDDDE